MDGGALALRGSGRAKREELMQSDARAKRDAFLGKIGSRAIIMGILNLTPDSFSDGGRFQTLDAALAQAKKMVAEGCDIVDVGGESTRPGATPVSEAEELARIDACWSVARGLAMVDAVRGGQRWVAVEAQGGGRPARRRAWRHPHQ